MAIEITIRDSKGGEEKLQEPDDNTRVKMSMQVRKTLDGNFMITDHPDMDIVLMPEKMKVMALTKDKMDDFVYSTQSRLFDFLVKNGIILPESVKGGNVYGSLEATIAPPTKKIAIDQMVLFSIGKFIESEKPDYMFDQALDDKEDQRLLRPDEEDSTEFGEIPHAAEKGSIRPRNTRRYIQGF